MGKSNPGFTSFNGGEIGREIMARVGIENYGATAELMENWLPETSGCMSFRPGMRFCVHSRPSAGAGIGGRIEPFVVSLGSGVVSDQKYLLLFTAGQLCFAENGGIIVTQAVGSAITNGDFSTLAGWSGISLGGSTAAAVDGRLVLDGDGGNIAGVRQQVATSSPGARHSFQIIVDRGPVTFRCGSTAGGDDYIATSTLRRGSHVLSFTPSSSNYWIEFVSALDRQVLVDSITVLGAGDLTHATPWSAADLRGLRLEQSLRVMYVSDGKNAKRRIEVRGADSWSLTLADEQDGPFLSPNVDDTLSLTPSVRTGNGSLTASRALFKPQHVGALFKVVHSGQFESRVVTAADQWSDPVRVTGIGDGRTIYWTTSGTWTGTVRLQRSVGNATTWEDVTEGNGDWARTGNGSFAYRDGQDNVTIFYRIGIKTGEYTSGTANVTIEFRAGSTEGICRVTAFGSSTFVGMEVLDSFARTTASVEWSEGAWSDYRGHPKGVGIFNGRLWNGFADQIWGSGSDLYESQRAGDQDADAIVRTISIGAQAPQALWLLGLGRLMVGTTGSSADVNPIRVQTGLIAVGSSNLDEALTPANTSIKGLAASGIYVDQSGHTAMELSWSSEASDYRPRSLMRLHRDLGRPGIVQLAFAQRPDARLFMVRSDGVCLVKLFDPGENVFGWARIVTAGLIKSVAVLPGLMEDEVYFLVDRGQAGGYYLERLDPMYVAAAADANRLDSFVRYSGAPATNLTGLGHLNGRTVRIWADGAYMGDSLVTGGTLATPLPASKSKIVAGLSYTALYRSSKLAIGAQAGTALAQRGKASSVAFLLQNSTRMLEYGSGFDVMDMLADRNGDAAYDTGPGLVNETTEFFKVPGDTSRDARLCLRAQSPWPVTVQGYALGHNLAEKVQA